MHTMQFALLLALLAEETPARKTLFFQMLKAGIIGRKLPVEIADRVSQMGWNRLTAVHNAKNFSKT